MHLTTTVLLLVLKTVIELDWRLFGALYGAPLSLDLDGLIKLVEWCGLKLVELLELHSLYLFTRRIKRLVVSTR